MGCPLPVQWPQLYYDSCHHSDLERLKYLPEDPREEKSGVWQLLAAQTAET